jgi:hypothetical protein
MPQVLKKKLTRRQLGESMRKGVSRRRMKEQWKQGLLRLLHGVLGNKRMKLGKKLSPLVEFHSLCWSPLSPYSPIVYSPQKKGGKLVYFVVFLFARFQQ